MNREFLDYVEDILDAMEKAELLVESVAYQEFEADFRINFAVVRALEIVGEATKRLPAEVRNRYPDVPWREMAGMRDKIIHGYERTMPRPEPVIGAIALVEDRLGPIGYEFRSSRHNLTSHQVEIAPISPPDHLTSRF